MSRCQNSIFGICWTYQRSLTCETDCYFNCNTPTTFSSMPFFKKAKPLQKPDDAEHAYQYALFLLNLRLRTEGEMWTKMQTRGYYPDVIDQVVKQLKEEKLIDDDRYIEIYIDNMKLYKHYGVFMMKKKLISKKLPMELIETKLSEMVSDEDEQQIAKRYVEKEYGKIEEIKKYNYEDKQKVIHRLVSRGFRINVVTKLINS